MTVASFTEKGWSKKEWMRRGMVEIGSRIIIISHELELVEVGVGNRRSPQVDADHYRNESFWISCIRTTMTSTSVVELELASQTPLPGSVSSLSLYSQQTSENLHGEELELQDFSIIEDDLPGMQNALTTPVSSANMSSLPPVDGGRKAWQFVSLPPLHQIVSELSVQSYWGRSLLKLLHGAFQIRLALYLTRTSKTKTMRLSPMLLRFFLWLAHFPLA